MRRVENAKQSAGPGSFNNYQFDFGLGGGLSKGSTNAPLKDQKQPGDETPWATPQVPKPAAVSTGWSGYQAGTGWSSQSKVSEGLGGMSSQVRGSSTQAGWEGYQPMTQGLGGAKQPAAATGIRSMNAAPMNSSLRSDNNSKLSAAGIAGGVGKSQSGKGADVFGDLLGAALNRSSAPLNSINRSSAPKPSFSMGNLDSSLPKAEEAAKPGIPMARMPTSSSTPPPERRPMHSSAAERDPFPPVHGSSGLSSEDDFFNFPSGAASSTSTPPAAGMSSSDPFGLSGSSSSVGGSTADPFSFGGASGRSVPPQRAPPPARSTPMADPFDVFKSSPSSAARKPFDPVDSLLSKSSKPAPPAPAPVHDDGWGILGGGGSSGGSNEPTTTELEGLPPPPAGVTAKAANDKGSEFYKNGQFPDAIKWLSWSVELLKSSPSKALLVEDLTCRASCYKEIGEMKKAVADCTQAIALQPASTSLIMLRANLYESMEKYKLGVADLRLVLKIDSDHRQARATLSRLERMIGK